MKYNGFISYSHVSDGQLAPALQSSLERFAKPWYKLRNLDLFRDETNLSITPHLWSNIKQALDDSEYLIYIASPRSAKSKWVNKEIEYWLNTKSLESLLIVLSDGHLNWEDDFHKMSEKENVSLPPVLKNSFKEEPFYVDLRNMRTDLDLTLKNPIFKKEILKLAAQLHGKAAKDLASLEVSNYRKMIWTRNIGIILLLSLSIYLFLSIQLAEERKLLAEKMIDNNTESAKIVLNINKEAKSKLKEAQSVLDTLFEAQRVDKIKKIGSLTKWDFTIYFDFDKFNLNAQSRRELDYLIYVLSIEDELSIKLEVPYYYSFLTNEERIWFENLPKDTTEIIEAFNNYKTLNDILEELREVSESEEVDKRGVLNEDYSFHFQLMKCRSVLEYIKSRGIDLNGRYVVDFKINFTDELIQQYEDLNNMKDKFEFFAKNDFIKIQFY
ncbi:toll/interleukin-1 receptor domain-containing protein [Algoriphagus machipongonensis]|uniref:Membrane protein n=1 Tax=Algoriphagus machipongonensis TaxID=388413 RepID=A3I187_9BACT|nr:toll/interleukin-1 receptor domain-containing protein [Algoriphagus machipongonensis]EAZ80233.1 membrane protein [Algoriphagus machipongonensis]